MKSQAAARDTRFFYRFLLAGRSILSVLPPLPPPFVLAMVLILLKVVRVDISRFLDQYNQTEKVIMEVEKGDAFIDVGASMGAWTLWASEKVGTEGKVIALEPNPLAFTWLARNSRNKSNVVLIRAAAHSIKGTIKIWSVNNSMSSTEHRDVVGRFMPLMSHGRLLEVGTLRVDSLQSLLGPSQPVVLKVDVEGAEMEVLHGAEGIIPRVKMAIVEAHSDSLRRQVEEFLGNHGFGTRFSHREVFAWRQGDEETDSTHIGQSGPATLLA